MQNDVNSIIYKFLNRWTYNDIKRMPLDDYIDSNFGMTSRDFITLNTFCFWVEYAHFIEKSINLKESNEVRKFRFGYNNCNRYGIISKVNTKHYESSLFGWNKATKNSVKVNDAIFKDFYFDNDGIYYDDYSLELQINKEGFYIFEEIFKDVTEYDAFVYGYRIFPQIDTKDEEFIDSKLENSVVYKFDNQHTWLEKFGQTKNDAFKSIKNEILKIIEFSQNKKLEKIEASELSHIFAWKIAYLYASDSIIPIFRKKTLIKCAENFGYDFKESSYTELQKFLTERKPSNFTNNYDYARYLLWSISNINEKDSLDIKMKSLRKSVEIKRVEQQVRKAIDSYTVEQRHNLLQNKFNEMLVSKFGKSVVKMEEDFVDIKLFFPDSIVFYEVKSDLSASACIKNALGQILWYTFVDKDKRKKKIVVVGQFAPTNQEVLFIEFLKKTLEIEFDYEYLEINDVE